MSHCIDSLHFELVVLSRLNRHPDNLRLDYELPFRNFTHFRFPQAIVLVIFHEILRQVLCRVVFRYGIALQFDFLYLERSISILM